MILGVVAGRKLITGDTEGKENIELCVKKHSSTNMEVTNLWVEKLEEIVTCRIERNIKGLSKCTTTRGKRSAFYFMSFFFKSYHGVTA